MQRIIATIILASTSVVDAHPGHGANASSVSRVDLFIVVACIVAAVAFVRIARTDNAR